MFWPKAYANSVRAEVTGAVELSNSDASVPS